MRALKKWFKKSLPFLLAYPGLGLLRMLYATCKIEIRGLEQFIETASKEPCLVMLWHNRLVATPYLIKKYAPQFTYTGFISKSQDGDLMAAVVNSYRQGRVIRVSPEASFNALREVIKQLKTGQEIILMTPDGPKGPKYRVKPGIVIAALNSTANVIPLTWSASRFWQLKTWDHFMIPKPFSKIVLSFGTPLKCNQSDPVEFNAKLLESALNSLTNSVCKEVSTIKE